MKASLESRGEELEVERQDGLEEVKRWGGGSRS